MIQKEHFLEQHDPERKDFQIDRIILFSDAVFAIAITLLIIEVKAPEVDHSHTTTADMLQQLVVLIPKFSSFIISFFVIAVYWRSHHRIFGFVNNYSERLIWINILFLFTIVLMPFSSAYYSENVGYNVPFIFYNINIIFTGIANYWMMRYVFNPKNSLVKHQPSPMYSHLFKSRAVAIPIYFFCAILLTPLPHFTSPIIYMGLWPMFYFIKKYNTRKYGNTAPVKQPHTKHKH
ncbi:putative membrane protein [Mucilaginibacter gracilis]|uniref:Putative membrane protein n=1 Tax=Mucilaginibacter gracilis TaxID=423350 RepID=A0A495IUJ3_9SPHI|nr:TMEM175 family protein [Mucilaginibacter gracilis]RKR80242.1 putative membrane protein [Mucilaginibacter gracilis]